MPHRCICLSVCCGVSKYPVFHARAHNPIQLLVSYYVMSFQRCVVCMLVSARTLHVWVAECLASVELLPDWDLMSPEPCLLLHLWVCVFAHFSFSQLLVGAAKTLISHQGPDAHFCLCVCVFASVLYCYAHPQLWSIVFLVLDAQ